MAIFIFQVPLPHFGLLCSLIIIPLWSKSPTVLYVVSDVVIRFLFIKQWSSLLEFALLMCVYSILVSFLFLQPSTRSNFSSIGCMIFPYLNIHFCVCCVSILLLDLFPKQFESPRIILFVLLFSVLLFFDFL